MSEVPGLLFIAAALLFFAAGSIGLLRLPDVLSRLHALTKADNVGLGLLIVGAALLGGDPVLAVKLLLVWLLVMAASSASAHLIARQVSSGKKDASWK
ncbi:MAG: monovalent cation/H(+) antiporter subunit G [Gammaproteobacteria bacterium]|jgi:multicomponent Na+:H+ antiporter subunit G